MSDSICALGYAGPWEDLKRVEVIPGGVEPGDEERFISLVSSPEDILVVFRRWPGRVPLRRDSKLGAQGCFDGGDQGHQGIGSVSARKTL